MAGKRLRREADEATRLIGRIIVVCRQIARHPDEHALYWLGRVLEAAQFAKISSKRSGARGAHTPPAPSDAIPTLPVRI